MSTTSIRDRIAIIINLGNGPAKRALSNTQRVLTPEEASRYGHHLEDAGAALDRSLDLDRQRKERSTAMFEAGAREADELHDARASALHKVLVSFSEEEGVADELRAVAREVRALFFPRTLEEAVRRPYKDEVAAAASASAAYEGSELQRRVEAHPWLAGFVDRFASAARALAELVDPQRQAEIPYAAVREANIEANDHLREFAWHVAGTLTEGDAASAARRDAILEPYFIEIAQQRAAYARRGAGGAGEVAASDEVSGEPGGAPSGRGDAAA